MTALPAVRRRRRVLVRDIGLVVLLNTAVAGLLVLFSMALTPAASPGLRWQALELQFVFSQSIGFSIFAMVEWARLTLWWQRPASLPSVAVVLTTAIPAGYVGGSLLASWLTHTPPQPTVAPSAGAAGVFAITVLASFAALHLITQRERLETARLRAESAEARAASARLRLLQQQIEPHMLFNTLANLHALIDSEPARAQQLLESLSELLHASMQMGEQALVPLSQEFELLRHYLALMQVRMGRRLAYALDLPPALAAAAVPPLSLQPLVENAIKHGVDPQVSGGSVRVQARTQGGELRIDVIDDGVGLPQAPLGATESTRGIGLDNLRRRLECAFGPRARLLLAAEPPRGTRATVIIPDEHSRSDR